MVHFEWDENKNRLSQGKHGVSFEMAQYAFTDPLRVIIRDLDHEKDEKRFFCLGAVDGGILTVRYSLRGERIRIYGAGYWRAGRKRYEQKNKIHR